MTIQRYIEQYELERLSAIPHGAEARLIDTIHHEIGCPGWIDHKGVRYSVAVKDGEEVIHRQEIRGYGSVA